MAAHVQERPPLGGLRVNDAGAAWTLYILRCADGTLYTGITSDPVRREQQHNDGSAAKYTRSRRPVQIVYREACADKSAALSREIAVKRLTRRQKEHLIGSVAP